MLASLRIKNFAIVDELELDFSAGMTAFTGETGAGKSIMIDALMLALGGRADTSVIRAGADTCDIQASFTLSSASLPAQWLLEHDVVIEHDEIFLRRVMFAEGRSKSYINGIVFPLQKVKELSEMLVDIHGQHQHQSLLNHATHRQQLDQYANHSALLNEVQQRYRQCHVLQDKLERLQAQTVHGERFGLLQYQIDELDQLNLQEGEVKALHDEHQLLHHAREYLEHTQIITNLLQTDDQPNVRQSLNDAIHYLTLLPEDNIHVKNALDLMNQALIQCDEAFNEMSAFSHQVLLDPERLQEVELRMSALHHAARKYHVDVEQLAAHAFQLQNELACLNNSEIEKQQLEHEHKQAVTAYEEAALTLRASRIKQASLLSKEITLTIQQLGMPKGFVEIEVSALDKMHAHGLDKVEYKVCTNPGMLPDSLAKIVSGGELSRISLGIQMITAQRGTTPTLLFDEVDVGIGGATAALVGQLLRKLGDRLQVFCVTHQPQVASNAHHHFVVAKYVDNQQTFSRITPLENHAKIDEIARMLGGLTITEQSRSHAKELLESAAAD
ncbi:MAG: DNA repair protein RecN [Legionellaceae bacterium]|nr:DNA repair protein RecN [Legionellaceae bacterium]